ncbi:glycoside hydrolase family 92 protein, partial [Flavobacteriales bacterium]|nr:glycoside hydrolase family 92 protein [Flavobacteriales bacterium]
MIKKIFPFLILLLSCNTEKKSLTQYVNPFIGTDGHGHTYPGASSSFGMIQLSPDTRLDGWDGCGGYHYSDNIMYGFSHTHLSGTGVSDYGDILLMPTTGEILLINGSNGTEGYKSTFSHQNETARAGYYSVTLEDYNIDVELTVSKRAGFHKYTFNSDKEAQLILDLHHRDKLTSSNIQVVNNNSI